MTNKYYLDKIQATLIRTARSALGNESYVWGHKDVMKEIKWKSVIDMRDMSIQRFVHKTLNLGQPQYLNDLMTKDRTPRVLHENKAKGHLPNFGIGQKTRSSIRFNAVTLYNNLPQNLTLLRSHSRLKGWLKMFYVNKEDLPKKQNRV